LEIDSYARLKKGDNGLILEVEAAYRRNQLDPSGVGNVFGHASFSTGGTTDFTDTDESVEFGGGDGHISAVPLNIIIKDRRPSYPRRASNF
jgi:hypothetical protein